MPYRPYRRIFRRSRAFYNSFFRRRIYRRRRRKPKKPPQTLLRDPNPKRLVYVQPIKEVLAVVHPELKISKKSLQILNQLFVGLLDHLAKAAMRYRLRKHKYKRMDVNEVRNATAMVIGEGQLLENAISEGEKALVTYKEFHRLQKEERTTMAS